MRLSILAILLGFCVALPQFYALAKPASFAAAVRGFARSLIWGYVCMALGTAWFIWNLSQESISDFAAYKPHMMMGFAAVGLLTCIYVSDFLAVRGLAIVLMLLAKLMIDSARWSDSEWRLVMITWAYGLVVAGIWFTAYPWRLRDFLHWSTASESRIRLGSGLRLGFGLLVIILGLTVL